MKTSALLSLRDDKQIGIFSFKITLYRFLKHCKHCFSLVNGKQLKGKVIRFFKRKSNPPHRSYAKNAL